MSKPLRLTNFALRFAQLQDTSCSLLADVPPSGARCCLSRGSALGDAVDVSASFTEQDTDRGVRARHLTVSEYLADEAVEDECELDDEGPHAFIVDQAFACGDGDKMEFAYFETGDTYARRHAAELLPEGRTYGLGKGWSVRVDRTHHDPTLMHNHLIFRKNEIAVINQDGSASHNTDLNQVPNWVVGELRKRGLTEEFFQEVSTWYLVPAETIAEAVRHEELMDAAIRFMRETSANGSP